MERCSWSELMTYPMSNLLAQLESVMQELQEKWDIVLVAVVTDASGEC